MPSSTGSGARPYNFRSDWESWLGQCRYVWNSWISCAERFYWQCEPFVSYIIMWRNIIYITSPDIMRLFSGCSAFFDFAIFLRLTRSKLFHAPTPLLMTHFAKTFIIRNLYGGVYLMCTESNNRKLSAIFPGHWNSVYIFNPVTTAFVPKETKNLKK